MNHFWKFKNIAGAAPELLLYGEISSNRSWLDDEGMVYADEFVEELKLLGNVPQINVRINSPGGDITAAIAIYTELKTNPAKVICIVDGLAASAATLVMMAADEIQMPDGALLMVHDPLADMSGLYKADDLEKQSETLKLIKANLIPIYAVRTGRKPDDIAALMQQETWMGADDAIENGFADKKIDEAVETKIDMKGKVLYMNSVKHDISAFKTMPELKNAKNIEDAITDDGNAGKGFVTRFVALVKNAAKKSEPDEPDEESDGNPDDEPDGDKDCGGKNKGKAKAKKTAKTEDDTEDEAEDADKKEHAKNVLQLTKKYPNLVNRIVNEAAAAERARIQEIDDIAGQINPELAAKAKYETFATAKDVAFEQMKSPQGKGTQYLNAFAAQTQRSNVKNIGAVPGAFSENSEESQIQAAGTMIAGFANRARGGNYSGKCSE